MHVACLLRPHQSHMLLSAAPLSLFLGWQHWLWYFPQNGKTTLFFFSSDNLHVWPCWEGPHSEWSFCHSNEGLWMPRWPCMLSITRDWLVGASSIWILVWFHRAVILSCYVMMAHTVGNKGRLLFVCHDRPEDQLKQPLQWSFNLTKYFQ